MKMQQGKRNTLTNYCIGSDLFAGTFYYNRCGCHQCLHPTLKHVHNYNLVCGSAEECHLYLYKWSPGRLSIVDAWHHGYHQRF